MNSNAPLKNAEWMILVEGAYGRAMLRAHGLEMELASMLLCNATATSRGQVVGERVTRLTKEQILRLPLGLLIKHFVAAFSVSEDIADELDNLLFFRNELAHRISRIILKGLSKQDHQGWPQVIRELKDIASFFDDADELLAPYRRASAAALGLTEDELVEAAGRIYPGMANVGR